jgi:hypothetical protein
MSSELKVRVQSLNDAENGIPMFEQDPLLLTEINKMTVAIIERGTVGKQDVVAFLIEGTNETNFIQITARQMEALYQCFKGAELRFKDEKAQKN